MRIAPGRRYWFDRTPPSRRRTYPAFRGEATADAVVVGGGLTGCLAARVLSAAGLDVVLLEADRLAGGATAGSLGAILPDPDGLFRSVEQAAGRRTARLAWKEARRSALELGSTLAKVSSRLNLTPSAFVITARTAAEATGLRREQTARKKAGIEAPWLAPAAVQDELGLEATGGLRSRSAFVYDPVRATLALASDAATRGARVCERSPVRRTRFSRTEAEVVLATGTIRTRMVYVATGDPSPLFGQLRRHVRRSEAVAVVTEPLTAPMRRAMGRRASVVTEPGPSPRWLRWLPDDRAMFAGGAFRPSSARQLDALVDRRAAELMYELSVRYPEMSGLPAAWRWAMPILSTADGLPWVGPHRNFPFHFFALAMGWHGDAIAWFAAKAAARWLKGEARKEDAAFGFTR